MNYIENLGSLVPKTLCIISPTLYLHVNKPIVRAPIKLVSLFDTYVPFTPVSPIFPKQSSNPPCLHGAPSLKAQACNQHQIDALFPFNK